MINSSFPSQLAHIFVAQGFEIGKQELLDYLSFQSASVLKLSTHITPQQIAGNSTIKAVRLLQDCGIPYHVVPVELGGHLDIDRWTAEWVGVRMCVESMSGRVPLAIRDRPQEELTTHSTLSAMIRRPVGKAGPKRQLLFPRRANVSEEDYCRQRHLLYARRHVQKQNLELLSLEGQKEQLEQQNRILCQQNIQMEHALRLALVLMSQPPINCHYST